jgi:F0F1-type ATP synthase membrane subunit c/vacuolar-type H+-ATPase subunit K
VSSKQNNQVNLDAQFRTMLIAWFAFLSAIVIYFLLSLVLPRHEEATNRLLTILLSAGGAFLVVISFPVKKSFLSRSVEVQEVRLVNTGFILAAAFCEAAALLGLLDLLVARDRYYFVLLALAFVGLLLHFPRRTYLESATYRQFGGMGLS